MTFARTVLGDIAPEEMGVTDAHEHIIIAGGRPGEMSADFVLADADKAVEELTRAKAKGLRTVVDAMPIGLGRDAEMLADVSRRSGVHVIAPTGIHTPAWYVDLHWSNRLGAERLAPLMIADVAEGIDRFDYTGPIVERTEVRAGVIKIGGTADFPTDRDAAVFEAAAITQQQTGVPILTHADGGMRGVEQARFLADHGANLSHVLLSHVDKIVDRGYHREIAATGARVEFDQGFRWGDKPNGTLQVLEWLVEDGLTDHVTLGLDAARQGYWEVYGGSPGITWFVVGLSALLTDRGIGEDVQRRFYVDNPQAAYTFIE